MGQAPSCTVGRHGVQPQFWPCVAVAVSRRGVVGVWLGVSLCQHACDRRSACVGAVAARIYRLGFWLLLPALLPSQIAPVVGDTFGAPHGSRFQPVIGHTQFVVFLPQLDSVFLVAGGIGLHAHPVSHRVGGALRHPVLQPQQPLYPTDFARQMLDYALQPPRSPRRAKAVSEHQFWQLLQCVGQAVWHLPNAASRCAHVVWRRISTHPRPLCCQPMAVATLVRTHIQGSAKLAGQTRRFAFADCQCRRCLVSHRDLLRAV